MKNACLYGQRALLPENAFSYVGSIDEAFDKSKDVKSDNSDNNSNVEEVSNDESSVSDEEDSDKE